MSIGGEMSGISVRLRDLANEKLGFRAASLDAALRKAGRRLPRRVRAAGKRIVSAQKLADHPKLSRQVDMDRVRRDARHVELYLAEIDPADRRKGAILSVLGSLAFNLLAFAALALAFARWRGWV
ncbi:MAG: hypothetical protein ACU0DK_17430 [Pseudooceanicola sp.]